MAEPGIGLAENRMIGAAGQRWQTAPAKEEAVPHREQAGPSAFQVARRRSRLAVNGNADDEPPDLEPRSSAHRAVRKGRSFFLCWASRAPSGRLLDRG
jgi:hypothetical protein